MTPGDSRTTARPADDRLIELFDRALDLPAGERDAFLDRAGRSDPEWADRVRVLLAALDSAQGFLEPPAAHQPNPETGTRAGPYRLVELLGSGGMSQVYRAVRTDGAYRRDVAVKILKRGLDTDALVRRFRGERQILATLDHPFIARLFDGGSTDDGRPYFVMERIDGTPITHYCDQRKLTLRQRVELFRSVCSAVEYAHRHLVVHRDLKPANILVTAAGTPKLLDFGIAKLLAPEATSEPPLTTRFGKAPLTPEYASPEQLAGGTVTTASDVYALGAVLHELLVGQRKHRPAAPDVGGRATSAAGRPRRLDPDLANIVRKATRTDPELRYRSVNHLSDDLQRYLDGLPVHARGFGFLYRAGKLVRRHWLALGGAAALMLVLTTAACLLALQARRIATERDRAHQARQQAERERDAAHEVTEFIIGIFDLADPRQERGGTVTAREILDAAPERIRRELAGRPEQQAALLEAVGRVQTNLGLYDRAEAPLEAAVALRRGAGRGAGVAGLVSALRSRGALALESGELQRAEASYRDALATARSDPAAEAKIEVGLLVDLGRALLHAGRYQDAEGVLREAMRAGRAGLADGAVETLRAKSAMALLEFEIGHFAEAESLWLEALPLWRRTPGAELELADALVHYSTFALLHGRREEAQELSREALRLRRQRLGPEHPLVAESMAHLGTALARSGPLDEAEGLLERALRIQRRVLGPDHPAVARTLLGLGVLQDSRGNSDAALELWWEGVRACEASSPHPHPAVAFWLSAIAAVEQRRGNAAEARRALETALEVRRQTLPRSSPLTRFTADWLAGLLREGGRDAEADALLATLRANGWAPVPAAYAMP